jgi:hypothetical protein
LGVLLDIKSKDNHQKGKNKSMLLEDNFSLSLSTVRQRAIN